MPLLTRSSGSETNIGSECTDSISNSLKSDPSSDCSRLLESAINSNLFQSSISSVPSTKTPQSSSSSTAIVTPTTTTVAASQCCPPTNSTPTITDGIFHSTLLDESSIEPIVQNPKSNSISQIPLSPILIGAAAACASQSRTAVPMDLDDFDELAAKIQQETKAPKSAKREKLKSFIEFDDEEDDGHNFDSTSEPYNQINGSEYGQEFSKVFNKTYDGNPKLEDIVTRSTEEEEEWNQFQAHSDQNNIGLEDHDNNNLFNSIEGQLNVEEEIDENVDCDDDDEDDDEDDGDEDEVDEDAFIESGQLYNKLHRLEQEQDLLNNSLLALTSHFAQVQFRLRQIVDAKDVGEEKRAKLLQELENFANRGIPELIIGSSPTAQQLIQNSHPGRLERSVSMATSLMADDVFEDDDDVTDNTSKLDDLNNLRLSDPMGDDNSKNNNNNNNNDNGDEWNQSSQYFDCDSYRQGQGFTPTSRATSRHHSTTSTTMLVTEEKLERQRSKQRELIEQLKDQLEDLERYAYETGELNSLPSSMLLERQNAIIEQIKSKLPVLSIDEIDKLSPEELRQKVDTAVKELVNPALMKEQLVSQLKTQVTDLERFIEFLQQAGAYKNGSKNLKQSKLSFLRMSKLLKFQKKYSSNSNQSTTTTIDGTTKNNEKQTNKSWNSRLKIGTNCPNGNVADKTSNDTIQDNVISSENNIDKPRLSSNRSQKNSTSSVRSEASVASLNFDTSANNSSNYSNDVNKSNSASADTATSESSAQTAAIKIIRRIFSLLHVFTWTQFGLCSSFVRYSDSNSANSNHHRPNRGYFEQNVLKKSDGPYGRHWGDLRAKLDIVINSILELYREKNMNDSDYTSDSEEFATIDEDGIVNSRESGMVMVATTHTKSDTSSDIGCISRNGNLRQGNRNGGSTANSLQYFAYEQMTVLVRKELSTVLRNLIQHGLTVGSSGAGQQPVVDEYGKSRPVGPGRPVCRNVRNSNNQSSSSTTSLATSIIASTASHAASGLLTLSRLGCFSTQSREISGNTMMMIKQRPLHAWELILYYYDLKNGTRFRSTPTRRLSQSFGLQAVTGTVCNPKHSLLAAIDDIIDSHTRLKRSYDSHFKAFVCMGLNQQLLSHWLRLILRQTSIVSDCYEKWSYTASTGFEDALRQLDKLSTLRFCLPTNLAIRQLQSIHDAF